MYFPGDPLFALDPIYQAVTDPAARDRLVATLRPRRDAARVEHRLPLGHRPHRLRTAPRSKETPSDRPDPPADPRPDHRPVLRVRAAVRRRPRARPAHPDRRGPAARPGARRRRPARARRAARAVAVRPRRRDRAGRAGSLQRDGYTFTGWGRAATDRTGRYQFTTLRPGARTRRRTSRSPCSRAGCSTGSSPVPTCPARRGTTLLPPVPAGAAAHPRGRGRRPRVRVRHPAPGRGRDRLLRLRARLSPWRTSSGPATSAPGRTSPRPRWCGRWSRSSRTGSARELDVPGDLDDLARRGRVGRQPGHPPGPAAARAGPRRAPRADQPGRARLRADADGGGGRRRPARRPRCRRPARWRASRARTARPRWSARTLTQHAVPTTFGFRVAAWLTAVLDAVDDLDRLQFPPQVGGAAGTRAALVELGRRAARRPAALAHDAGAGHPDRRRARRLSPTRARGSPTTCS